MIKNFLLAVFDLIGVFQSFIISLVSHLPVWALTLVFDGTMVNADASFFIGLFTLLLPGFAIYHVSMSLLAATGFVQLLAIRSARISLLLVCLIIPLILISYRVIKIPIPFDIYPALFASFTILLTLLAWSRLRMYKIQGDM